MEVVKLLGLQEFWQHQVLRGLVARAEGNIVLYKGTIKSSFSITNFKMMVLISAKIHIIFTLLASFVCHRSRYRLSRLFFLSEFVSLCCSGNWSISSKLLNLWGEYLS